MTGRDRDRDRDQAGRPRNARPRDGSGRPLPRGTAGEPQLPDDLALAPEATVDLAQELLDAGRPFQAHEVLEAAWKSAPDADRELWRGLAQVAVGLTHAQRGNVRGAVTLLNRGADRLTEWLASGATAGPPPYGINIVSARQWARTLAGRIETTGLDGVSAADRRLRLRD